MLYSFSNSTQTISANAPLAFNNNGVLTGCTVTHSAGSTGISLNRAGLYYVTVTATGTSITAGTTLALQLYSNGVAQPGAISQATVGTANGVVELVINKIVRVLPNCQALNSNVPNVLTIVNTSTADETFINATITVTKVG